MYYYWRGSSYEDSWSPDYCWTKQLCFAHGIQLRVIDVIYNGVAAEPEDDEPTCEVNAADDDACSDEAETERIDENFDHGVTIEIEAPSINVDFSENHGLTMIKKIR